MVLIWPIWLWPILIFRVADMVYCCGRYRLAVADLVVADMVCGRYGARPERTMSSLGKNPSLAAAGALYGSLAFCARLGKKSRLAMFSLASCHGAAMLTTKNDIIIYALIFDE